MQTKTCKTCQKEFTLFLVNDKDGKPIGHTEENYPCPFCHLVEERPKAFRETLPLEEKDQYEIIFGKEDYPNLL